MITGVVALNVITTKPAGPPVACRGVSLAGRCERAGPPGAGCRTAAGGPPKVLVIGEGKELQVIRRYEHGTEVWSASSAETRLERGKGLLILRAPRRQFARSPLSSLTAS